MHKFILSLRPSDGRSSSVVEGEFEYDEVERLRNYLTYAEEMTNLSLLKTGDFGKLKIRQPTDGGAPEITVTLPSEEAVAALLHKLRRFILHKEPTSFNNITALLKRRFRHPAIFSIVERERELFDGRTGQSQIEFIADGVLVNSDATLRTWLNSCGEYHEDSEGKKEVDKLKELLTDKATNYLLLTVLDDKTQAVINIARFIALMFKETNPHKVS